VECTLWFVRRAATVPRVSQSLASSLTRFDATMIVMGTIVGVGIFFQPQKTAAATGSAGWSLTAWLLGSVLALTGAFTYAALGKLEPRTGGPYIYLREAFGSLAAFLYGWMVLVAIGSGAIAVVGLIFVDYLTRYLGIDPALHFGPHGRSLLAATTILLLASVNAAGLKWGSRVQNVLTIIKILSLSALVFAGLARGEREITFAVAVGHEPTTMFHGLFPAMAGVLFSFGGWQNLSNVAGEMKNPQKDLAPSIVLGVLGVAVLYVLANVGFLSLLTIEELTTSTTPAADALARAFGDGAGRIATLMIMLSAFGIVNGLLLSLPRIYYAMAQDGMLPKMFASVSARNSTPVVAIVVQAAVAVGFCFMRSVGALTEYVAFADWFFFSLNAIAVFVLARRVGGNIGLGYPVIPAIFAVLSIVVTIGMMITTWENARLGVLFLVAGTVIHFVVSWFRRTPSPS